jgi:fatty acid desaturase
LNWFYNTFIGHNLGYHALHHKYSSIPWFRLPEAYRAHKAEIVEQVSHGYWETFAQIITYTSDLQGRLESQMPDAGSSGVGVGP